jgi:ubiquinone/menaquinone biosynthesis C-methylase UbiE
VAETRRRILEVGCGTGRNLPELLREDRAIFAVDSDVDAVSTARSLLTESASNAVSFSAARMEALSFRDRTFDSVYCLDVLHWASDLGQFKAMWKGAWRVLRPGGIFVVRLRCRNPEVSTNHTDTPWFLASRVLINTLAQECGGEWITACETIPMPDLTEAVSFTLQKRIVE